MVEGATESLSEYISFIQKREICFTQIRRRMVRLLKGKKPAEMIIRAQNGNGEPITALVDSTGLTTTTKEGSVHRGKTEEGEKKVLSNCTF
jgi:hypothetical protein